MLLHCYNMLLLLLLLLLSVIMTYSMWKLITIRWY